MIADVIVLPEYQGQGIGKRMVEQVMSFIQQGIRPGQTVFAQLMAAKGKEGFYRQFGFQERPSERLGAGMSMQLTYREED